MTLRHYRLPSLHALATFEASARHRSFKRAADELNVTAGAVSRQIKALEEELGAPLFERAPGGLTPTAAGEALRGVLSDAFGRIGETIGQIRFGQQPQVTVASTHGFAKCWLMPRMIQFWRSHPDICVNHLISDDGRDYRRPEVDLRIRYGFGSWPGETTVKLFDDVLYPVVAPGFATRHAAASVDDLSKLPLLHVDWVDPDWTGWDALLRHGHVARAGLAGQRFGNFDVALQACKDGQGIAVGWHRMVEGLLARGELVRFTDLSMPAPGAYYLTWNANMTLKDQAAEFRAWLVAEAQGAGLTAETQAACI